MLNKKRKREELEKDLKQYSKYVKGLMECCLGVLIHLRSTPYFCQISNWHSISLDMMTIITYCELIISSQFSKIYNSIALDGHLNNLKLEYQILKKKSSISSEEKCPLFSSPINMQGQCEPCPLFADKTVITNIMHEILIILRPEHIKIINETDLIQELLDLKRRKKICPTIPTDRTYMMSFSNPLDPTKNHDKENNKK